MIETIRYIEKRLTMVYPPHEAHDMAWWIAEETTGLSRTQLLCGCKGTKNIPHLEIILDRLCKKEPIEYIFGHCLWYGLDLRLSPDTLIPRPETAELVDHILHTMIPYHRKTLRVLDIGTGSGCIAIALAKAQPTWAITGIDISPSALAIARQNAINNGVDVHFKQVDILSEEVGYYDLIVSNPPYICEQEKADMDNNVLDYEPHIALFVPNDDPLLFYRRIASMRKAPYLFFEINQSYAQEVQQLLHNLNYQSIELLHDIYGNPRILSGQTPC